MQTEAVRVDEDTGRMIERTKDLRGLWYYRRREYDGGLSWVGIRNVDGYLRMGFRSFGDMMRWLKGGNLSEIRREYEAKERNA